MIRKPTRPRMVDPPRRNPSFQLPSKRIDLQPRSILRRPGKQRYGGLKKRVHFASGPKTYPVPTPAPETKSPAASTGLPRRVDISTYAREPFSLLREILSEKTKDPEPELFYAAQVPVTTGRRDIQRPAPAFPGVKLHRLWKLRPGLYCLLGWDKPRREVLIRHHNSVVRTPLPVGVVEPPAATSKTFLEIGRPEDGQRHQRVSVKWVSV